MGPGCGGEWPVHLDVAGRSIVRYAWCALPLPLRCHTAAPGRFVRLTRKRLISPPRIRPHAVVRRPATGIYPRSRVCSPHRVRLRHSLSACPRAAQLVVLPASEVVLGERPFARGALSPFWEAHALAGWGLYARWCTLRKVIFVRVQTCGGSRSGVALPGTLVRWW